ncbi:unnamed protein product [Bursaphelenchus xylophilus]|uniref:(pine wood nematode) hypothetical protein n=1 Tax=Bursaphelenchus xylophilus TaxID=6326 RepID=A0A1I7RPY6_BURXY|nr:unnamed protein product [Bursaphelenchus xylophilus]CAG9096835.1 unnamed protein product [Bursaphelenchus xylophilus]
MSRKQEDGKQESVSSLKARFTEAGDFNLANQLQEEEYKEFYDSNRNARRVSSQDHKLSKEEHQKILDEYLQSLSETERKDAEFAMQLQRELEEEERLARENQAKEDEELARRLAQEERAGTSAVPANEADLIDFGPPE